jgi:hypothetical protein
MGALHKIRPDIKIDSKYLRKKKRKKYIEELSKKVLKVLASDPQGVFLFETVAEELCVPVRDIVDCQRDLDKKGIQIYQEWQSVIVDGIEYNNFDFRYGDGLKFPEGSSNEK